MSLEKFIDEVKLAEHPRLQTAFTILFYGWSGLYGAAAYGVLSAPAWMQEQIHGGIAKAQFEGLGYTLASVGLFVFSTWLAVPVIKKYVWRGTSIS